MKEANKRYFISWLAASVTMFAASCAWHGMVLNDFERLTIPLNTYLMIASLVYLVLGAIFVLVYYFLDLRGANYNGGLFFCGFSGLFIYLLVFVESTAFVPDIQVPHLFIDMGWQIAEQLAGGATCALVFAYYRRRARMLPQ